MVFEGPWVGRETPLTLAIWSNLPKSSLSISTSSLGEHSLASRVKPTMSAYSTLHRAEHVNGARLQLLFPPLKGPGLQFRVPPAKGPGLQFSVPPTRPGCNSGSLP